MVDVLGGLYNLDPHNLFWADNLRGVNSSGVGLC